MQKNSYRIYFSNSKKDLYMISHFITYDLNRLGLLKTALINHFKGVMTSSITIGNLRKLFRVRLKWF